MGMPVPRLVPISRSSPMSFNGLHLLAPGDSFTPLRAKEAPALKCASCGATLGLHEARCSYCLSWSPAYSDLGGPDVIEVTNLDDPVPRYWVGGYVASSKRTPLLEAPPTFSDAELRAIEVFWRSLHELLSFVDRLCARLFGSRS
jgi:hypothetical protein